MSFLINPLIDLFDSYRTGKSTNRVLWTTTMKMLMKSIEYDEGGTDEVISLHEVPN